MNFNRKLVTGLFGLALIAAPITAAAKDNDSGRNNSHQEQAQPSHSNDSHPEARHPEQASHNEGREQHAAQPREQHAAQPQVREQPREQHQAARVENRQDNRNAENRQDNRQDNRNVVREQRNERVGSNEYRGQPEAARENNRVEHRDAREDRREGNWNRDRHEGGDHDGHWIYGDRGRDYDLAYDPDYDREYESGWVMPKGYGGGACAWARHLRNVYRHDQYTGHPAAAESLIWQMRRAERACGGVPYGYNTYRYPY